MKVVAESQEVLRIPISAAQGGLLVDPSNGGVRGATIALKQQGTRATNPGDFTIVGSWESDTNASPDRYWVVFTLPGTLAAGKDYQGYVKLATLSGETPILAFPNLIEAI